MATLLAIGIDPERSVVFVQSSVCDLVGADIRVMLMRDWIGTATSGALLAVTLYGYFLGWTFKNDGMEGL